MGCCGGDDYDDYEPRYPEDASRRQTTEEMRNHLSAVMQPLDVDWQSEATVNVSWSAPAGRPGVGAFERRQTMRGGSSPTTPAQRQGGHSSALEWTDSRKLLEAAIAMEQMEPIPESSPVAPPTWGWGGAEAAGVAAEEARLEQRLFKLKLAHHVMEGDGNCQFRAVSFGMFGTQKHHPYVRRRAVQYMQQQPQDFAAFLGQDWGGYVRQMSQPGTWGDELTLRATCEALGVVVNVVSSDEQYWFLRYIPRTTRPQHEIFMTYVAPIHYNAIRRQNTGTRLRQSFGRQGSQLARAVSTYQRRYGMPETPQHVVAATLQGA